MKRLTCHTCYRHEDEVEFHDVNWCEHCFAKWHLKKFGRYPYGYVPEPKEDLAHSIQK